MLTVKIGTVTLNYVQAAQPTTEAAANSFISAAGKGALSKTWNIDGYILAFDGALMSQKEALETSLIDQGDCALNIDNGKVTFQGRVARINWSAYHTGPIWTYSIEFVPESKSNPFIGTVQVGSTVLANPTPALTEKYKTVTDDDPISAIYSRTFELSGRYIGTKAQIESFYDALEAEITTPTDGYFTFTTPMGIYQARCIAFDVQRPEAIEIQQPVTWTMTVETKRDYSIEQYQMGHTPVNIAGITFDILNSFSHTIERIQIGTTSTFKIDSESMSWSLTKFFNSVANADAYKPNFESLLNSRTTMFSPTGTLLECKSISYNVVTRSGYYSNGDKRYALTISLTFSKPSGERVMPGGMAFGIYFNELDSDSLGVSIDENGSVTSRSRNVSGKMSYSPVSILGQAIIENGYTYYITGVNVGAIDENGLYAVSVSGRTLDNAKQAELFISEAFDGAFFDDVTSKSRSVSQNEIGDTNTYEVTSMTESISGYMWGRDAGAVLGLVTLAQSTVGIGKITNASHGAKEPFTRPDTKQETYRQSASLTRVTNYAATEVDEETGEEEETTEPPRFDPSQPDIKIDETWTIDKQTDRFQVITIPGGEIVYKKVGVNPAKATARITKTAVNYKKFESMDFPSDPQVPPGFTGDNEETVDRKGEQGLSRWREKAWESRQIT